MDEQFEETDFRQMAPHVPALHHSAGIKNLWAALIQAQAEFKPVVKNKTATVYSQKTGKSFYYKYADLADVLAMALPVLTRHELGIIQPNIFVGNQLRVVTHLIHSSGEWMCGDGFALIETGPRQDVGTDATYNRRYDLCSLLGIVADEDIDAQKDLPPAPAPKAVRQPSPVKTNQVFEPHTFRSEAEQLLDRRDAIIAKIKAIEPDGHVLGQRAKALFPGHENTKTLTVPDLEQLLEVLEKDKDVQKPVDVPVTEVQADVPPNVATMMGKGKVTTASQLQQGATIGKGLAQRLHKLIGIHKVHTEEDLKREYLDPMGCEHVSDLPRNLYDSLCKWAEGDALKGPNDFDEGEVLKN
jgi:hypothetical protein